MTDSARDEWYCLGALGEIAAGASTTRLMGVPMALHRTGEAVTVTVAETETGAGGGRSLPALLRFGCLWTSLGSPARPLFDIAETAEPDRRHVPCGAVTVRASGLRIVENFLDMAHFPFVHTDILGAEPHTEVRHYACEIRREADEVWATDCSFPQPKAALSAAGAIETDYVYRIANPMAVLLYKTCPVAAGRRDVICLFVQPLAPDLCRAHPVMFLIDDGAAQRDLIQFQQVIFLQDRIILENQRPRLLPLEPRAETPTRADASSIAYRRWLKEKGYRYGTTAGAAA